MANDCVDLGERYLERPVQIENVTCSIGRNDKSLRDLCGKQGTDS